MHKFQFNQSDFMSTDNQYSAQQPKFDDVYEIYMWLSLEKNIPTENGNFVINQENAYKFNIEKIISASVNNKMCIKYC